MSKFDGLYRIVPVWMQNLLVSTFGLYWHWARFGGDYRKHLAGYRQRELYSNRQWKAYQETRLKAILSICSQYVPYYRTRWNENVQSAALNADLSGIPILEKEEIRRFHELLIRDDVKKLIKYKFHTSGTTGTPIISTFTRSELQSSMAIREARSANWAGVSFDQPRATFSGRIIEPDPGEKRHIYRYNAVEKQVYFSAFHLSSQTAKWYIAALKKHNVKWMTGYAVSFYLLAKYVLSQDMDVPEIAAIVTTSEKLTPEMRVIIEKAFHTKVFEEYSTVENALFASECEQGRLHVSPDVGVVEILRPDGSACEPGEVGEVVTTCLLRTYQPLIRFRLGDLAAWDQEECPCGRKMPVIKEIVGRIEDVVTGTDGRQLVRFHGIFTDQPHIIEGQIIQESLVNFTVKVVPTNNFNLDDVEDITNRMRQRLGNKINVKVETVESIPRSKAGKFQAVISKVN